MNSSKTSEYKTRIFLGAIVAVIIAAGLAVAAMSIAPQLGISSSSQQSTQQQLPNSSPSDSLLIVQLTDPPTVPEGTTSLNLTYTMIDLLVAEPIISTFTSTSTGTSAITTGTSTQISTSTTTITVTSTQSGQVTSQTVAITPKGGSATVDLLKLQNISLTLGSANLPSGTTIYSVSFTVSSINIEINGSVSPVALATGGNSLLITLAKPSIPEGTSALLLDLNPTVINTPTGYQMIPSSVGVIKPQSEITNQDSKVGWTHQLSDEDQNEIHQAKGQLTTSLLALSVSGTTSTVTVQVSNTGNSPLHLVAIGLQGNFVAQGTSCTSTNTEQQQGDHGHQSDSGHNDCGNFNEVVFVPIVATTTTSASLTTLTTTSSTTASATSTASCTQRQMAPAHSSDGISDEGKLVINPGQCIVLTFTGAISFGQSSITLVPSTASSQVYIVHVIASNGGQMKLSCTLPLSSNSCKAASED